MATFDIKDLYVNIPIEETLKITEQQLLKNNDEHKTQQLITMLHTILKQNYIEYQNKIYHPKKGVAMGSPISGTITEIFLQHIEDRHIKHLLDSKVISFYTRYVDDIFIIYDINRTTTEKIQTYIDHIHKNIKLTPTFEDNRQISFLDMQITRKKKELSIAIYRKPTTTDTTINYLSNHPREQKIAAYRYFIKRMIKFPMDKENKMKEWNTICKMAHNNNFPHSIIRELKYRIEHNTTQQKPKDSTKKWATFTYYSPQIRKITNLFKHTEVKIAFRNTNNIQQIVKDKENNRTEQYNRSGIYSLTCKTCKHRYIGQTSRELKQRYQEHMRYIKNNNPQLAFALHILNNRHEYGAIDEIMTLLKPIKHKQLLIPYEQYFIQTHHQQNKLITEQSPGEYNPLIQLAIDATRVTELKNQY
jgi:hypothetical protein